MKIRPALWLCLASLTLAVTSGMAQEVSISQKPKLKAFTIVRPARDANGNLRSPADASANSALATFNYTTVSSRDGNTYSGLMVGQDPFSFWTIYCHHSRHSNHSLDHYDEIRRLQSQQGRNSLQDQGIHDLRSHSG